MNSNTFGQFPDQIISHFDQQQNNSPSNSTLDKYIHLVWYIIDCTANDSILQEFEEKLCRELFVDLPILFILNKIDQCSRQQIDQFRENIESLKISHSIGIVEFSAQKLRENNSIPQEKCAHCESSEELVVVNAAKMSVCQSCGKQTLFKTPDELENLLQ